MKKLAIALCALLYFLTVGILEASAQTAQPQFLLTWRAKSYAPAAFPGKVLPTTNSPVAASFELIDPNTGSFIDLSRTIIDPDTGRLTTRQAYKAKIDQKNKELSDTIGEEFTPFPLPPPASIVWFVNDQLIKRGLGGDPGTQAVSFLAPAFGGIQLKVQLSDFDLNAPFFDTLDIPVVQPEVVVENPFQGNTFSTTAVELRAVPYFWNTTNPSELVFSWSVNGEQAKNAENPADLIVNLNADAPSGSQLSVSVSVKNSKNDRESSGDFLGLTYVK